MRIGICAPGGAIGEEIAEQVSEIAADKFRDAELIFDPQCFASAGHFAGSDDERADTFISLANDPDIDAIWFARGGYGAARIAENAVARLRKPALQKAYLGYSDMGNLLSVLYREGIGQPVHGPMPADISREGGEAAILRALRWLTSRDPDCLAAEARDESRPVVAFNLITLAMLCGTPLLPDLSGHVVMVEEVAEYHYAVDRLLFGVTTHLADRGLAGLRLGRVSHVPENNRPFGEEPEAMARRWCERTGIPWLGCADIGHDAANKIVPFGTYRG